MLNQIMKNKQLQDSNPCNKLEQQHTENVNPSILTSVINLQSQPPEESKCEFPNSLLKYDRSAEVTFNKVETKKYDHKRIFNLALETIVRNSVYSRDKVLSRFKRFENFDFETFYDQYLYQVLAYIPFYAGMKSKTVTSKIDTIKGYFPNYESVAAYDELFIKKIMSDPKMIKHKGKIRAAITNARTVGELVKRHSSFKGYLTSLNFNRSADDLERAAAILQKTFAYMGGVTVHHFLTDIGAKTVKPDRVIMRVLSRLKLVENENCIGAARKICNRFVEETGLSHRYIDIVLVKLGHVEDDLDIGLNPGICLETSPSCSKCLLRPNCYYKLK